MTFHLIFTQLGAILIGVTLLCQKMTRAMQISAIQHFIVRSYFETLLFLLILSFLCLIRFLDKRKRRNIRSETNFMLNSKTQRECHLLTIHC